MIGRGVHGAPTSQDQAPPGVKLPQTTFKATRYRTPNGLKIITLHSTKHTIPLLPVSLELRASLRSHLMRTTTDGVSTTFVHLLHFLAQDLSESNTVRAKPSLSWICRSMDVLRGVWTLPLIPKYSTLARPTILLLIGQQPEVKLQEM